MPAAVHFILYVADQGASSAFYARDLGPLAPRDWGDEVAYALDPDGHVLAFARRPDSIGGSA